MTEGTVKFFNESKSFGFIAGEDGNDYFVHASEIKDGPITEGDKVSFTPEKGDKGLKAVDVKKI